jgi:hypothetical protein
MKPDQSVITGLLPDGMTVRALADSGKAYGIYLSKTTGGDFNYAIRWIGRIVPKESGIDTLFTLSDDGIRLWVNGKKVIENWNDHGTTEDNAAVRLMPGVPAEIKIEFYQGLGGAVAQLKGCGKSFMKQIIPSDWFILPDGKGNGLKADLYGDKSFTKLRKTAVTENVDFAGVLNSIFPWDASKSQKPEPVPLAINLPKGKYDVEWIDTKSGNVLQKSSINHAGGDKALEAPKFEMDVALRILLKN